MNRTVNTSKQPNVLNNVTYKHNGQKKNRKIRNYI